MFQNYSKTQTDLRNYKPPLLHMAIKFNVEAE